MIEPEPFMPPEPPVPAAPPVQAGPVVQAAPAWPMALGVVMIVFGAAGLLMNGFQTCQAIIVLVFAIPPAASDGLGGWTLASAGAAAVSGAVSALLLAAGIAMIKRRPHAPRSSLRWAWIRIVVAPIAIAIGTIQGWLSMQSLLNDPNSPAFMRSFMPALLLGMTVLGLLWAWALPIFIIWWFRRPAVLDETRTWNRPAATEFP